MIHPYIRPAFLLLLLKKDNGMRSSRCFWIGRRWSLMLKRLIPCWMWVKCSNIMQSNQAQELDNRFLCRVAASCWIHRRCLGLHRLKESINSWFVPTWMWLHWIPSSSRPWPFEFWCLKLSTVSSYPYLKQVESGSLSFNVFSIVTHLKRKQPEPFLHSVVCPQEKHQVGFCRP